MIKMKMKPLDTDNMSARLRKMAIDRYVVRLELPELRELTSKMKQISNGEIKLPSGLMKSGEIFCKLHSYIIKLVVWNQSALQ